MIIQNKEDIFKAFDKLDKDLQNELTATVTKKAFNYSKHYSRKTLDTGQMLDELKMSAVGDTGYIIGYAPHTIFVHFGTKPHIIQPKEKSYLRWVKNISFKHRKVVYSKGFKGNPFIYDGIKEAFKHIDKYASKIIDDI